MCKVKTLECNNFLECFKFKDLATRVAIIPIVEFGDKISSKFQDLTTHS